jgi:hypothetical protein
VAPPDRGRREAAGHEALVGVDVRREQQGEVPQRRQLAGEEVLEDGGEAGPLALAVAGEDRPPSSVTRLKWTWQELPSRGVVLGHEGDADAVLGGDLLGPVL